MTLNYPFGKIIRGEAITPEEIAFAEGFVSSETAEDAIMANSILLRGGDGTQRVIAYDRLRRICQEGSFYVSDKAVATLLLILEYFSKRQLEANSCFIDFVYQAAKHPFLGARINAMRVLRQLAKTDDPKAIQLLKESLHDPHPHVSKTAQASLKLAGVKT